MNDVMMKTQMALQILCGLAANSGQNGLQPSELVDMAWFMAETLIDKKNEAESEIDE